VDIETETTQMTTFTATDPNGTTHTRNSKKAFTHAVLAIETYEPRGYLVIGFASSLLLAEKLMRSAENLAHKGVPAYSDVCLVSAR
jgi:hypothetical protein